MTVLRRSWRTILCILVLLGIVVFSVYLVVPLENSRRIVALWLRLELFVLVASVLFLLVSHRMQVCKPVFRNIPVPENTHPFKSFIGLLAISLSLYLLQLALLWSRGVFSESMVSFFTIGGFIPWSDASGYLAGAQSMVEKGVLSQWVCKRPLTSLYLGSLLGFTNQNLHLSLVVCAIVAAVTASLASFMIWATFGSAAAISFSLVSFWFYRQIVGATITEDLGFSLGCLAFTLLLLGVIRNKRCILLGGMFILTISLFARAGPFLILPFLIVGFSFDLATKRFSLSTLLLTSIAVSAGFFLNKYCVSFFCPPGNITFSNFAHTLYGLAVGGKGWEQISVDYPQLEASMSADLFAKEVYRISLEHIVRDPLLFFQGLWNGFFHYLLYEMNLIPPSKGLTWIFYSIGFVVSGKLIIDRTERKRALGRLLFLGNLGVLCSAPFLAVDGGSRVFASTIPFSAALLAVGVSVIAGMKPEDRVSEFALGQATRGAVGLAVFFVVLILGSPVISRLSSTPIPKNEGYYCEGDKQLLLVRNVPGLSLLLMSKHDSDEKVSTEFSPQELSRSLCRAGAGGCKALSQLASGNSLLGAYDLLSGGWYYLLVEGFPDARSGNLHWYCRGELLGDCRQFYRTMPARKEAGMEDIRYQGKAPLSMSENLR